MLTLRPYQIDIVDETRKFLRAGKRSVLISSATGSGKTALTAHMLANASSRGKRSWFVVHRRELVRQSVQTLTESAGLSVGIVAAGFPPNRHERVQVCSVQTLVRRTHLLVPPDLIVWDEIHHAVAASWAALRAKYPNAVHIGLTATPERLDGQGLRKYFGDMVAGPSVRQLVVDGWLSDYKLYAPSAADLSGVHTVAGDYNKRELSLAMSKSTVTGDALTHYRKYADGKRFLAFLWSIEASKALAAQFCAAGIPTEHVDGEADDATRDGAMERFRRGETLGLCNVDLFGEGVDVPALECVILLRPTKSLALYLQQVGRAGRTAPGKTHAIILDHAGNSRMHGLPDDERTWTLDGRDKRKGKGEAPVRQCPACFATVQAAAKECRYCGYVFAASPREVDQVEGELVDIDPHRKLVDREYARREEQQARTLDALIGVGRKRGYKSPERWASHVFNARLAKQAGREAGQWALGLESARIERAG